MEQFFKEFGIEKTGCKNEMGVACPEEKYTYPPITSDIVLGLEEIIRKSADIINICIDNEGYQLEYILGERAFCSCCCEFDYDKRFFINADNFKYLILFACIQLKDEIQDQVRALFNAK